MARLTALLIFLWPKGLLGSPEAPAVNREPPDGATAPPPPKLNIPGPAMLLLTADALKLNPPGAGAGAVYRNKKQKGSQLQKIDQHCLLEMMTCTKLQSFRPNPVRPDYYLRGKSMKERKLGSFSLEKINTSSMNFQSGRPVYRVRRPVVLALSVRVQREKHQFLCSVAIKRPLKCSQACIFEFPLMSRHLIANRRKREKKKK